LLFDFLFTGIAVDAFREELISENVLKRLMKQNIVEELCANEVTDREIYLYQHEVPCDSFILILQGNASSSSVLISPRTICTLCY